MGSARTYASAPPPPQAFSYEDAEGDVNDSLTIVNAILSRKNTSQGGCVLRRKLRTPCGGRPQGASRSGNVVGRMEA